MDSRILSSFVILLIALAYADARFGIENLMEQGNKAYSMKGKSGHTCSSCLEASRNAQKVLNDLNFFSEIKSLSSKTCHVLPSQSQYKQCLDNSEAYIHQAEFLLQELLHEESLCNSTGLCGDESVFPNENALTSVTNESPETEEDICLECNEAVKSIINVLETPRLKKKIMQVLVGQCEEERQGQSERKCKQTLNKYASRIFLKLAELKSNELCQMMSFCS